jgi:hypothetical protein
MDAGSCVSPRRGERPCLAGREVAEPNPRSLPLKGREAVAWMQVLKSPRIGEKGPAYRVERLPEPNPRSLPLKGRDVRAECPASPRVGEKGPAWRVERLHGRVEVLVQRQL